MVVASLISETTRLNLQQFLDQAKAIRHDKGGLSANYELLLRLRSIWEFLDKRRKEEDKAEKDIIATRKAGYEEIMNPIAELLDAADPHIFALNTGILLEERRIGDAIQKQITTRDSLAEFVNDTIRTIVGAPDNKELVRIQKLIGSEKSHKNRYGEYAPIAEEAFDDLLKLIDGRKKLIVESTRLEEGLKNAIKENDQPAVIQIKEMLEVGKRELEENAAGIADDAFKKVSGLPIVGSDFISKAVKPRTHRWSWRVDDIELLYKKRPDLVVKEPNTKAINAFLKEKTEAEELDEYTETSFSGLTLFRKPFYTSVKGQKDAS